MTGASNLPPGVTVNMIPGNRAEDQANELFFEELEKKFSEEYAQQPHLIDALKYGTNAENLDEALISRLDYG